MKKRYLFFEKGIPANKETADFILNRQLILTPVRTRDYQNHKNYFQVISIFSDTIPAQVQYMLLGNIEVTPDNLPELVRKAIQLKVGSVTPSVVSVHGNAFLAQIPKSISYEDMGQDEFRKLYIDTKTWIYETLKGVAGWSDDDLVGVFGNLKN